MFLVFPRVLSPPPPPPSPPLSHVLDLHPARPHACAHACTHPRARMRRLPAAFVVRCNAMNEVWVPSEFSRDVFVRRAGAWEPSRPGTLGILGF